MNIIKELKNFPGIQTEFESEEEFKVIINNYIDRYAHKLNKIKALIDDINE